MAETGELESDGDGEGGDDEGVEQQRDNARTLREIGFDVALDNFFDDFIPGQSGDEAKAGGGER